MQALWTSRNINFITEERNRQSKKRADDIEGKKRINEYIVWGNRKDEKTVDTEVRSTSDVLEGGSNRAGHIKNSKGEEFAASSITCIEFVKVDYEEEE